VVQFCSPIQVEVMIIRSRRKTRFIAAICSQDKERAEQRGVVPRLGPCDSLELNLAFVHLFSKLIVSRADDGADELGTQELHDVEDRRDRLDAEPSGISANSFPSAQKKIGRRV